MNTIGRYEILQKIGQGGMGTVFKAFDPVLERVVAVKVISAQLDDSPAIRERFFREARSAGQLSHKNIVIVYDLGEEERQPYLAMEYLEGANFETRMRTSGRVRFTRAIKLVTEVCEGLEYAHSRGVLHRDIKPANLFLTDSGAVKVLDFGLARLVTSELTRSQNVVGTANYMSPEQVRGERVDQRADVFAVGVVLYELLAGRKAFSGDSFATIVYKILQEVPEPLQRFDERIPRQLLDIVDRALAKAREERYQTMSEFLRDLVACQQAIHGSNPALAAYEATTPWPLREPPPPQTPGSGAPADSGQPGSRPLSIGRTRLAIAAMVIVLLLGGMWIVRSTRSAAPGTVPAPVTQHAPPAASSPVSPTPAPAPPPTVVTPPAETLAAGGQEKAPKPPPAPPTRRGGAVTSRTPEQPRSLQPNQEQLRADDALSKMSAAKGSAQSLDYSGPVARQALDEALAMERSGRDRYYAAAYSDAAAHFYQATAQFRSAELAARADDAARAQQQQQQQQQQRQKEEDDRRAAEAAARESAKPAVPPPAPAPPPAAAAAVTNVEQAQAAVKAVMNNYVDALERRSFDSLKRIWPDLSGDRERALRNELAHARSLSVQLSGPRIDVSGDSATVTAQRHYELVTDDGQRLSTDTDTTIHLRKAGESWVIHDIVHRRP